MNEVSLNQPEFAKKAQIAQRKLLEEYSKNFPDLNQKAIANHIGRFVAKLETEIFATDN